MPPIRRSRGNHVALSMIVRNEADRYLARVLHSALDLVDSAVIIDGVSQDDTVAVCERVLERVPHEIVALREPVAPEELRRLQWELVVATRPDWVLVMDADEVFEDRAAAAFRALVDDARFDLVGFRRYDLWDEDLYRDDAMWGAHRTWTPRLVRVDSELPPTFTGIRTPIPNDHLARPLVKSALRIRHLGTMDPADRERRAIQAHEGRPELCGLSADQLATILDETPHLVAWDPGGA
jgi:glycosyltransferase involved in cell wall biosynthesis